MRKHSRYDFIEWYRLEPLIRANLVTLIEGVRPGANIELWKQKGRRPRMFLEQKRDLELCLQRFHLVWREQRDDYYIAGAEDWLEQLFNRDIKAGEFLGYPQCCIRAFERGCRKVLSRGLKTGPAVWFCRKMERAYRQGLLSEHLLWALHVPCSLNCKDTRVMALKIKSALERCDNQAGYYFIECNVASLYEFRFRYPR